MQGVERLFGAFDLVEKSVAISGFRTVRLVFFGDSHAHALIRAKARTGVGAELNSVDVRRIEDLAVNAKQIPMNLASAFPADAVYCCLGGTEYNLVGLIESPVPYDFLLDPNDTCLPGRQIVPNGLARAAMVARMRSAKQRTLEIQAQFDCSFTCVAPPPPFAALDGSEKLPRVFAPLLERGIAPASVRLKWYLLQISLLEEDCGAAGIGFLPTPDAVRDPSGYLRREFWDNDPTHGNAAYGAAVVEQIRAHIHG